MNPDDLLYSPAFRFRESTSPAAAAWSPSQGDCATFSAGCSGRWQSVATNCTFVDVIFFGGGAGVHASSHSGVVRCATTVADNASLPVHAVWPPPKPGAKCAADRPTMETQFFSNDIFDGAVHSVVVEWSVQRLPVAAAFGGCSPARDDLEFVNGYFRVKHSFGEPWLVGRPLFYDPSHGWCVFAGARVRISMDSVVLADVHDLRHVPYVPARLVLFCVDPSQSVAAAPAGAAAGASVDDVGAGVTVHSIRSLAKLSRPPQDAGPGDVPILQYDPRHDFMLACMQTAAAESMADDEGVCRVASPPVPGNAEEQDLEVEKGVAGEAQGHGASAASWGLVSPRVDVRPLSSLLGDLRSPRSRQP